MYGAASRWRLYMGCASCKNVYMSRCVWLYIVNACSILFTAPSNLPSLFIFSSIRAQLSVPLRSIRPLAIAPADRGTVN